MKRTIFTLFLCALAYVGFGQALKVAADANVGIGVAAPTQKLDVDGNVIIPNNQYYMSFRSDGSTPHQAFGMDANNDIVFNRSAIVANATSSLIFGTADGVIDLRDKANSVMMRVRSSDGFVGVGTNTPSQALHLAFGNAAKPGGGSWLGTSDKRAKKNIKDYEDGLEEILKIKPVTYEYNGKFGTENSGSQYVGVIAQEMQEIAPYTVKKATFKNISSTYTAARGTEERIVSEEDYLTYDGTAITYMLVNAIKEQHAIIEEKEDRIIELEDQVAEIRSIVDELAGSPSTNQARFQSTVNLTKYDLANLEQNRPNPFSSATAIDYVIPSDANNAQIQIFDVQGRLIKSTALDHTGEGTLNVNTNGTLSPGSYNYSLIIDGKVTATKKMVISQ